jgi:hypothetical protein
MVIIRLPNRMEWYKPNWVFRQLLSDAVEVFGGDAELRYQLEKAEALGSLFLDSMDDACASKIVDAIKRIAQDTLQGKIKGNSKDWTNDKEGQRMYLEAIAELLDHIKDCVTAGK